MIVAKENKIKMLKDAERSIKQLQKKAKAEQLKYMVNAKSYK